MEMGKDRTIRYKRQLLLDEVGEDGQKKLSESKVLIIGAGGLGSPAALYLCAAGVGTIGIADNDAVELSNLNRQILHSTDSIGERKVVSADKSLKRLDPDININTYDIKVDENNIGELISGYDFVIDATDNFESKFIINDGCVKAGKAFCHGGILGFRGQLMTYVPHSGPCYRCIFKAPPPQEAVSDIRRKAVLGAVAGVIGALQAAEAVKYIVGCGALLTGRLLTFDCLDMIFREIKLPPYAEDCPLCGNHKV